jgi:hypothetical protein
VLAPGRPTAAVDENGSRELERTSMEGFMKRIKTTLVTTSALLAACTLLSGCVFAVGSTHEAQPKDRLDRLDTRVRNVERQLGIQTPAPEAGTTEPTTTKAAQ